MAEGLAKPFLIGIGGPSGSGKSELAALLLKRIESAAMVSVDSYYRELSHLSSEERENVNFDHPDSIEWPLLTNHLEQLAVGQPIEEPVYLFCEHTRSTESRTIQPAEVVFVEGILALAQPEVREKLNLLVYVDTPDGVCFQRRLDRDVQQRGRTEASVRRQYEETVRPMAEKFVWPSRRWAHLVVSGCEPLDASAAMVMRAVRTRGGFRRTDMETANH